MFFKLLITNYICRLSFINFFLLFSEVCDFVVSEYRSSERIKNYVQRTVFIATLPFIQVQQNDRLSTVFIKNYFILGKNKK